MKRTIVHLVYSLGYGGLEQVIVNLINSSKDYEIQHVIITLVNIHDLYEKITDKVPIYSLDKKPQSDFSSHYKLFVILKKIQPDAINTYNFGTIEYQFTAFLAGVRTRVHSDHGRGGDDSSGTSIKRNLVRKAISLFLYKYVVVSPDLFKWGQETLGLKKNKIQLIYNGVDINKYTPGTDKYDKFTICTVGRSHPIKNQSLLIQAYKLVFDSNIEFQNSQLLIIGDGPIFKDLQEEVKLLGMDSNIKLLGYRDDVVDIMRKANLFVLSSNYEAMPMTVLEAMACELPVICTDVGGTRYLVTDKVGWLIQKGDVIEMKNAIEKAFLNPDDLFVKSEHGRELVVNNFSIENMVKEYLELYGVNP